MKLTISPKRKIANKLNAAKASAAWVNQSKVAYLADPAYCEQCSTILPQAKKNNKM